MQSKTNPTFAGLLRSAVAEPGTLSTAYRQFHAYSVGNMLLALFQCHQRGLGPGPMATFPRWKELGRHVRKGEKALTLCMPITIKRRDAADVDADSSAATFTRFVYRSRWFVCQGRSKIRPPWRRKTRPFGRWVEWRNAAVRRGRQDAGVAAGWRAFLLCSRRELSPFSSRMWTWWVSRSSSAPVSRSDPKISVHSLKGRFEVTSVDACS